MHRQGQLLKHTQLFFLSQKIPGRTEIPDLGASLVKLLQDFRVQVYVYVHM